jgi:hypothetical protein
LATPITYTVGGQQIQVAIGECSSTVQLPPGAAVITEQPHPSQLFLVGATTTPADRIVGFDVLGQTATVTIVAGSNTVAEIAVFALPPDPGGD